jgi:hypothetical protein
MPHTGGALPAACSCPAAGGLAAETQAVTPSSHRLGRAAGSVTRTSAPKASGRPRETRRPWLLRGRLAAPRRRTRLRGPPPRQPGTATSSRLRIGASAVKYPPPPAQGLAIWRLAALGVRGAKAGQLGPPHNRSSETRAAQQGPAGRKAP